MNVLNKEYQQLEEKIQLLREKWNLIVEKETLTDIEHVSSITSFPAIPQLKLNINVEQYHTFIQELFSMLEESQPALAMEFQKITPLLTKETLEQWFKEAIAINHFYFERFAKDNSIAEWIPFFAAEHALRPYLQKVSKELNGKLHRSESHGGCPACGEPPRIATINKQGKKDIACPRCLYTWEMKKIKCAHCGCEEPGKIEIIKVEKEESAEIYVCQECKGYTKVIDTRKLIKADSIPLLDIKTIHLDFVAQENGYGVPDIKDNH